MTFIKKPIIFFFLLTVLIGIAFSLYVFSEFQTGRNASLQQLDDNTTPENEQPPTEDTDIEFNSEHPIENEPINILLVGVDARQEEKARTDTIMIAQYHPKNESIKIASIMRDSYVSIPGYQKNKINTSFFLGGPELLRQTIKENFDIDLHYYAMVNFEGFIHVVDLIAPDGITVNVPKRMVHKNDINLYPGVQTLDGKQLLNYVRFRSDHENDFGRVRRQQETISLLKDELLTLKGLTRIPQLVGSIEPYVDTNMTTGKVISLGKDFVLHPVDEVETLTIPVQDGYEDRRYLHAGQVLELDIEKNKSALHDFFNLSPHHAAN